MPEPRSLPQSLPEQLAQKWRCTTFQGGHIAEAVREALENACSVIDGHIKELRLFQRGSRTVSVIVQELEIVREKIKTLRGEAQDAS